MALVEHILVDTRTFLCLNCDDWVHHKSRVITGQDIWIRNIYQQIKITKSDVFMTYMSIWVPKVSLGPVKSNPQHQNEWHYWTRMDIGIGKIYQQIKITKSDVFVMYMSIWPPKIQPPAPKLSKHSFSCILNINHIWWSEFPEFPLFFRCADRYFKFLTEFHKNTKGG